jgi:hypothetical protein
MNKIKIKKKSPDFFFAPRMGENLFSCSSDKGLISRICRELKKLNP